MTITRDQFGALPTGERVDRYHLSAGGLTADIITYGGILTSLKAPDRRGALGEVTLGFAALDPYLGNHPFFGALVGRYGNRIANGRFTLDGATYQLAQNDGANHLHGGPQGFHRKLWAAEASETDAGPQLTLRYTSPDMEEGYPGTLQATVIYTLTNAGELRIDYRATTDRPTVINLTNHTYFNLSGVGDILGHELEIPAARFIPSDAGQIPLGELRAVAGTPMDFTSRRRIGDRIGADDEQLRIAKGYDHTWVFDTPLGQLGRAALVFDPASGRVMEMFTTEPGVQFYSGCQLNGSLLGHDGQPIRQYGALCLEAQHFPDSPNQPQFPSTTLRPGETYQQTTIYRMSVEH
jgi:aldose 1-epimerase